MSDEKWRLLLEQQNRSFLHTFQAMQTPPTSVDIRLPDFDPDKRDLDSRVIASDMCVVFKVDL